MRSLPAARTVACHWQRAQSRSRQASAKSRHRVLRYGQPGIGPVRGQAETGRAGSPAQPAAPHPRRARAGRGMRPWPGADAGGPAAAGRWERTSGAAATRAAIAAPPRSATRRPRACGTGWSLPASGRSRPATRLTPASQGRRAAQSSAMAANAAQKMCVMTRVQGATNRSGSSDAVPALSRPADAAIFEERRVVSRTTTSVLAGRRRIRRRRFMAGVPFCRVAGAISGGAAFSRSDASRGLCPCRR